MEDLSYDEVEEVRPSAMAGHGTCGGEHPDLNGPRGEEDEEENEEEEDEEQDEMEDIGGEEKVDATRHRTDEEAQVALTQLRKWIAWQGYVPLKQPVWRGTRCRARSIR